MQLLVGCVGGGTVTEGLGTGWGGCFPCGSVSGTCGREREGQGWVGAAIWDASLEEAGPQPAWKRSRTQETGGREGAPGSGAASAR